MTPSEQLASDFETAVKAHMEAHSVSRVEAVQFVTFREQQIASGSILLPVDDAAKRAGFRGEKGKRRFIAKAGAGIIPAFDDGKSLKVHWPSLVAKLFPSGKASR